MADIKRQGKDVTVVGIHTMVGKALKAAEQLAEEGIELEVIDPRTLVPLDEQTIVESVKKTGRLIVSHEAYTRGGYGARDHQPRGRSRVRLSRRAAAARVRSRRAGAVQREVLETAALPQVDDIVAAARALVRKER